MKQRSVSSQTCSTIDIPYAITDKLPPIFGSKLCIQTRPVFISNSLPNLDTIVQVKTSEEDLLRDAAEEALSCMYDDEVTAYYEEARRKLVYLKKSHEEIRMIGPHDPH